jgi:hypothetical protein
VGRDLIGCCGLGFVSVFHGIAPVQCADRPELGTNPTDVQRMVGRPGQDRPAAPPEPILSGQWNGTRGRHGRSQEVPETVNKVGKARARRRQGAHGHRTLANEANEKPPIRGPIQHGGAIVPECWRTVQPSAPARRSNGSLR